MTLEMCFLVLLSEHLVPRLMQIPYLDQRFLDHGPQNTCWCFMGAWL